MRLADFNLTQVAGDRAGRQCGVLASKPGRGSGGASVRLDGARAGEGASGSYGGSSGVKRSSGDGFGLLGG